MGDDSGEVNYGTKWQKPMLASFVREQLVV
jgi:hypothetical protein